MRRLPRCASTVQRLSENRSVTVSGWGERPLPRLAARFVLRPAPAAAPARVAVDFAGAAGTAGGGPFLAPPPPASRRPLPAPPPGGVGGPPAGPGGPRPPRGGPARGRL